MPRSSLLPGLLSRARRRRAGRLRVLARWLAGTGVALGSALLTAPAGASPAAAVPQISVTLNGTRLGTTFQGIGAISGGGGNSRLLVDYPAATRRALLDYLFKPGFGASLQVLKLEIGGDGNSSDGSEPSVEHFRGSITCGAGYEFWLAKQALARNPHIALYGLQWTAPAWVNDGTGRLWSPADVSYVIDWLKCARSDGLPVRYLGAWNERFNRHITSREIAWFTAMRRALDENGFSSTVIVAPDENRHPFDVVYDMGKYPALKKAIAVIGAHDTCGVGSVGYKCTSTPAARSLSMKKGKPLWESELGDVLATGTDPAVRGPGGLARSLNNMHIQAAMRAALIWPMVDSMPADLPFERRGFLTADWPWSRYFRVNPLTWVVAQTTQFTAPGWRYLRGGSGDVQAPGSGSYVSYESPDRRDWSLVVETSVAKSAETLTVQVTGGLNRGPVHVWSTSLTGGKEFVRRPDAGTPSGRFSYRLQPGEVYSFTTTTGQSKAGGEQPPAGRATAMPVAYHAGGDLAGMPARLSPMEGAFAYSKGAIVQTAVGWPVQWLNGRPNGTPYAVVGSDSWRNYTVSAVALLPPAQRSDPQPGAVLIARFQGYHKVSHPGSYGGYELRIDRQGAWRLVRNGDRSSTLARGAVAPSAGYHLRLTVWNNLISAFVDGRRLASVRDGTYSHGLAGLGTLAYDETAFARFVVK